MHLDSTTLHDIVDMLTVPIWGWLLAILIVAVPLVAWWALTGWLWPFGEIHARLTSDDAPPLLIVEDEQERRLYEAITRPLAPPSFYPEHHLPAPRALRSIK